MRKLRTSIDFSRRESASALRRGILATGAKRDESTLKKGLIPKCNTGAARAVRMRRIMMQAARTQAAAAIDAMTEARPLTRPSRKP